MNKNTIVKYALANSLLTVLYVILVALFLNAAESIFKGTPNALIPAVMLLLFVFSAALCGALMLGRPILWYLDGRKKEAVLLFSYSLVILLIAFAVVLAIIAIVG